MITYYYNGDYLIPFNRVIFCSMDFDTTKQFPYGSEVAIFMEGQRSCVIKGEYAQSFVENYRAWLATEGSTNP